MAKSQWLKGATRVPGETSGAAVPGSGPSILHHTTEGSSAAGAVSSYRSTRSWPTITAEWTGTRLAVFQHMGLDQMARALEHPPGTPETNRANVTQIEHVGFTDDEYRRRVGADPGLHVSRWSAARWAAIGALCREIEAITGCPASSGISAARWAKPNGWRQDAHDFVAYRGHTAHVFAPNNHHTDGTGFKIALILAANDAPHRSLRRGDTGPDVYALQLAVRLHAQRCGRKDHMPTADGVYGSVTERDAAFVAYILGIGKSQGELVKGGLSAYVQGLIRGPQHRNNTQKHRAGIRRPKHCKGA